MNFPLVFAFLVLLPVSLLEAATYDDLVETGVECSYSDTCQEEYADPFGDRTCGCESDCSETGTCCVDSPYRDDPAPAGQCRKVRLSFSQTGYVLVSRCPPGDESVWKDLCEGEWNGEEDITAFAPVSSLDTFVTYKNYYCFRCHEDGRRFLGWDLMIKSDGVDMRRVSEDFTVQYDKERRRWTATTGDNYVLGDIQWEFNPPAGAQVIPDSCRFVLVSDCAPSWTDEDVRGKCLSYTAVVYSKTNDSVSFKNPHCALCNSVPARNIDCGYDWTAMFGPKKVFSFAHLLNVHRDESDRAEAQKCQENQLWDPYGKKCRRIACAVPGYVVKEGRCMRP